MARVANGLCVLGQEFAFAVGDELVELGVDQLPHEIFVFLEPARRQQLAQQGPFALVGRRVHDNHVLEDRKLVPVRFDLFGDVVTVRFERQRWKRSTDGVDRGEGVDVLERRHDLRVTRDGDDAVVWLLVARDRGYAGIRSSRRGPGRWPHR